MNRIRLFLKDGKRSQRGSVLSAVLIITAFIAILAGALMTELSTNFVVSNDHMTRVANEATASSAVELSLSQLQSAPLNSHCPAPSPLTLNNRTAVPTLVSCWPTVDAGSPQFQRLGGATAQFSVDGTHAPGPTAYGDYVVGNAGGTVFDYAFGSTSPRWTLPLGGSITGPPLVIPDPHTGGAYLDAIPASGAACSPAAYCLNVRSDQGSTSPPVAFCSAPASSAIVTQPFLSPAANNPGLVYFAYGTHLVSNDLSAGGTNCDPEGGTTTSTSQPIVAGPIAFCGSGSCPGSDDVYVVVSDSSSSSLIEFQGSYGLNQKGSLGLPWGNVLGMTSSSATLPATLAITFQDGGVALVSLAANGSMKVASSYSIGSSIGAPPYWCGPAQCGSLLVGVGLRNGSLFVFDSSLSLLGGSAPGSAISTSPVTDGAGNWYVVTDDGFVHELQIQGPTLLQVRTYGRMAQIGSSIELGSCAAGICLYMGGLDNNAYLVPLNARDAVITACVNPSPCLWAQVEIGVPGNPQKVHVQGWSYYSA